MSNISAEMIFAGKLVREKAGPFGGADSDDYSMPDLTFRSPSTGEVWAGVVALIAGTVTLDLTALPEIDGGTTDLTGMRVLWYRIDSLAAADLTFKGAATNPYPIFVGTTGHVVGPSSTMAQYDPTGFGTVSGTVKSITVTGTGTDSFRLGLFADTPE